MKALVVGGYGLVGTALAGALRQAGHQVLITTRRAEKIGLDDEGYWERLFLDLTNPRPFMFPNGLDVMYLVAAITKVVDCEADPASAWRVNADAPVELTRRAGRAGIGHTLFISSDAVERAPNLVYSRAKAYAESFVLAMGGVVVRPCRITTVTVTSFVEYIVELGKNGAGGLHHWNDQ